jgi:uncharacterized protein with von Willebrand factor type A (vWA) domain
VRAPGELAVKGPALLQNVAHFGRLLRGAGLPVDVAQSEAFARAIAALGVERKADVRAAGRAIFTRRREDRALFDAAFDLFWRRGTAVGEVSAELPRLRQHVSRGADAEYAGLPETAGERPVIVVDPASASTAEQLRTADFAALTADEARDARRMLAAIRPRLPLRPSRRGFVGRHGQRLASRRMLRLALAVGGELLEWRWRRRSARPRPIVLLCDISGSMERYSRFLLHFAHTLQQAGAPIEIFVFGTRLTRITRALRVRSADAALRRVAEQVVDWSGGTRIGESLRTLNRRWVQRTIRSGAVVLIVSDGWERGDPELLGREMATLRRSCHRLLWLDPLMSRPGFEPATAGLRAALPHIDALVPCASVASLEALAVRLGAL